MSKKIPIIDFNRSYTFSSYFELPYSIQDIVGEFGYSFERTQLYLERSSQELDRVEDLKSRIEEILPYVSTISEMARREFLIAPLLADLVHYTHCMIDPEYTLIVTEQLKGSLDYYIHKTYPLLIVEAKKADLDKGLTQLAIELIAIDQWTDSSVPYLMGAVSTGSVWQFARVKRDQKLITQDLALYTVPANLEDLLRIMIAILT